ncbi:ATP phosphoribosyltransferase regulatory subunit [Roseibium aquae]|uniref:ATP phosphoribosyltransferase regulatory subunit n=1 Tax=Roseibium aquae TaxID=1323746 RepID=A0A916TLI4_9HYPH|nr:ATP phosphoribosyltransferase regulatory subunit [Roseibium aquae]GGB52771.1 ATP phosphoribosyltransferase regulatory subunit [Roseibium aquae]
MAGSAQTMKAPEAGQIDAALALFRKAGHTLADPPILQPADLFLDLTGEDIRRRLYLTSGANGVDLCLRPDFTIPVCRAHLDAFGASKPAAYCYHGPVFRQRAEGLGEIPQIGAESFGDPHINAADAAMLALSVKAIHGFNIAEPQIRIGDEGLFVAVLSALGLPNVWQRRLRDLFGEGAKLDAALDRMAGTAGDQMDADNRSGLLAALHGSDPDAAQTIVEDLLSIAGISTVSGRSASEIAQRFLEQAALTSGTADLASAARILKDYLALQAPCDRAGDLLTAFANSHGMDLSAAIDTFEARVAAFAGKSLEPSDMTFHAGFGRRLDYYTGFIFEIYGPAGNQGGPLVGGGRYDRLLNLLGAGEDIPAIGFSIWLDRVAAAQEMCA